MSSLILPGRSKLAYALREPRLLTPIGQPVRRPNILQKWRGVATFALEAGHYEWADLVTGVPPNVANIARTFTEYGISATPTSNTGKIKWTGLYPIVPSAGFAILHVCAIPAGTGYSSREVVLGDESTNGYANCALIFNSSSSTVYSSGMVAYSEYGGSLRTRAEASSVLDGSWHIFVVNRYSQAAGNGADIYKDGVQVTSSSIAQDPPTITAGVEVRNSPHSSSFAVPYPSTLTAIFNRILTAEEIVRASEAYRRELFEPADQSPLIFDLGGGSGSGVSIGLTGASVSIAQGPSQYGLNIQLVE